MKLFVYGKINEFGGVLQVDAPEFEVISDEDGSQVGKIVPVYPSTEGLYQSSLRRAIADALDKYGPCLEEMIPDAIRERFELEPLEASMREIHFPTDWETKEKARYRLVFEELFLLQVALAQKKRAAHIEEAGIRHVVPDEEIKKFLAAPPLQTDRRPETGDERNPQDLAGAAPHEPFAARRRGQRQNHRGGLRPLVGLQNGHQAPCSPPPKFCRSSISLS